MRTFTDRYDQTWQLDMDLSAVRKIESYEFPNFGKISFFPPSEKLFQMLSETEVSFFALWMLCRDQIEGKTYICKKTAAKLPVTNEEDFAHCFNGDTIEKGKVAFFEELSDFFPQMRTTLMRLTERFSSLTKIVDQRMADKMTEELSDQRINQIIDETMNETEMPEKMRTAMERILDREDQKIPV